jgi:hypothetical protein
MKTFSVLDGGGSGADVQDRTQAARPFPGVAPTTHEVGKALPAPHEAKHQSTGSATFGSSPLICGCETLTAGFIAR